MIVLGARTQHDDDVFEVEDRASGKKETIAFKDLCERLARMAPVSC